MNPRHASRILALQALYEADMTGHPPGTVLSRHFTDAPGLPDDVRQFASALVSGVVKQANVLDARIRACAPEFPVDGLALVDRNILRIGLYELMLIDSPYVSTQAQPAEPAPVKVIVNEAVELGKEFGSDVSSRFINGVLAAAIVRYHQGWEGRAGSQETKRETNGSDS